MASTSDEVHASSSGSASASGGCRRDEPTGAQPSEDADALDDELDESEVFESDVFESDDFDPSDLSLELLALLDDRDDERLSVR